MANIIDSKGLYDLIESSSESLADLTTILSDVAEAMKNLNDEFNAGKVSQEDYDDTLNSLNSAFGVLTVKIEEAKKEEEKLTAELEKQEQQAEKVADKQQKLAKQYDDCESSVRKYGSTANTVLSIISASVKETNPALATAIGSVQKLIPNITECAAKFKDITKISEKAGTSVSKFGKLLKVATSPAGIMLLITAITTLITSWDKLAEGIGISSEKIESFRDKANNVINMVIKGIVGVGNAVVKFIATPLKTLASAFKKVFSGDFKGAFEDVKNGIKEQLSFKKNFQEGFESDFAKGIANVGKSKKVEDAATETGSNAAKAVIKGAEEVFNSKEFQDLLTKAQSAIDGAILSAVGFTSDKLPDYFKEYETVLEQVLGITDKKQKETEQAFRDIVLGLSDSDIASLEQDSVNTAEDIMKEQNEKIKAEQDQYNARIDNYKNFLDTYSSLSNTITDAISKNLDAELQAGKISEREYKRKKKVLQAFSIASIVASAASGLMDTWTGYAAETKTNAKATDPITMAALNAKSLASAIAKSALITTTAVTSIGSVKSESISSATPTSVSTPAPTINYVSNPSFQESADAAKQTADTVSQVADNTAQSNVVPVLVVESLDKVQKHMTSVQTNSSF